MGSANPSLPYIFEFSLSKNPKDFNCHDLWTYWKCQRPSGTLMFDFGSAEELQQIHGKSIIFETYYLRNMSESQKPSSRKRRVPEKP